MDKSTKSENPIKLTESGKPEKPEKPAKPSGCKYKGTLSMAIFIGLFVLIVVAIILPIALKYGKNSSDTNHIDFYNPYLLNEPNMTKSDIVTQNDTKNNTNTTYNG